MTFVFNLLIKMFKSCNKVFSDSIEISDCFPQQQIIKRKKHTAGNL
jgi:hypothetical protein